MGNSLQNLDVGDFDNLCDLQYGDSVEEIVQKIMLDDFVYRTTRLGSWVGKYWKLYYLRRSLQYVLKCDTTDWTIEQICDEIQKLYPTIIIRPQRFKTNAYWIRYKYPHEIDTRALSTVKV